MTSRMPIRMNGSSTAGRRAIKAVNVAHAESGLAMATCSQVTRMLVGRLTATWSKRLGGPADGFVCTDGGPGIIEAANRCVSEADGINTGVNVSRLFEQHDNPKIS